MKSIDMNKLGSIIDKESQTTTENMLYRDMFALACYLHQNGQEAAGLKLCKELFDHLGRNLRTTYFSTIESSLAGNEKEFAKSISAHLEINKLF